MRKHLHRLISGIAYGIFMVICIIMSIVPLAFREELPAFTPIEIASTAVFIFDYLARWITADLEAPERKYAFLKYPVQPMAIIDLASILPSFTALGRGFKLLKLVRMLRTLRIFRALKLVRYSRNMQIILNVLRKQRDALITVFMLAFAYIIISALIVFNIEPETFENFYEAIYWATVSLTTMGYGDIYPVTAIGRLVTMLSSILGIAIVALPAGIVTAGYMEEITKEKTEAIEEQEKVLQEKEVSP